MTARLSQRWKRNVVVLFVILLIVGVVAGIGLFVFVQAAGGLATVMKPTRYVTDVEGLERDIDVQLPESASDVHNVGYAYWQSRIIGVRFQIPPHELDGFLTNLGFTGQLQKGLYPFDSPELASEDWWTPREAEDYYGASFTQPETFYDLLIDKTNPSQFVVYLMVEQG